MIDTGGATEPLQEDQPKCHVVDTPCSVLNATIITKFDQDCKMPDHHLSRIVTINPNDRRRQGRN